MPGNTTTVRDETSARTGFIYLPIDDVFYPKWKIIVTDQDGIDYYVSDFEDGSNARNYLISADVTLPMTTKLGSANITLVDPVEDTGLCRFYGKFTGGEIVRIYADYTDATTLLFRGKIDNPSHSLAANNAFQMQLEVRDYPELADDVVTGSAYSSRADVVLADLFYTGGYTDIVLAFWNGSTWAEATYVASNRSVTWSDDVTTFPTLAVSMSWQNKKPLSVASEVCQRAGLESYLKYDEDNSQWQFRVFNSGSVTNADTTAAYGSNIIGLSNYGPDNNNVANVITVYGKTESSNIVLVATETDDTSISDLWRKPRIFTDASLVTNDEVRIKGEYELAKASTAILKGNVRIIGEENVRPGEQVAVGIPQLAISGYQIISEIKHNISSQGFITTLDFSREGDKVTTLLREKVNAEEATKPYENLNGMTDSFNIYFDETPSQISIHSDTEELDGKLRLQDGEVIGIATTNTHTSLTKTNVTQCELRKFSNFPVDENDTYEVTNDGGTTWEDYIIGSGQVHTFGTTGNELAVRLTLRRNSILDITPAYESIVLLYK